MPTHEQTRANIVYDNSTHLLTKIDSYIIEEVQINVKVKLRLIVEGYRKVLGIRESANELGRWTGWIAPLRLARSGGMRGLG
jgi:uncharacterized membrane protein